MSGIYNYFIGTTYNFEPTSLLKHQKFLIQKQILNNKLKLKNISEENRLIKEREESFIALIRERKQKKKKIVLRKVI